MKIFQKFIFETFQECCKNIKTFMNSVLGLLVYHENFQICFENIGKYSEKISRLFQKIQEKCSETFQEYSGNIKTVLKSVPDHPEDF